MKTIKESLDIIKSEFVNLFGEEIKDIRLEEIEKDVSYEEYDLTVSFLVPNNNLPAITAIAVSPYTRLYKKVRISYQTGDIISIKIHKNE